MLKKLVKYGNSNALILDKAILELLNIEEGSLIKIKTDGKSIILTPYKKANSEKVSETFTHDKAHADALIKELIKKRNKGDSKEHQKNDEKRLKDLISQASDLNEKLWKNQDFSKEFSGLTKKFDSKSLEYGKAYNVLLEKYSPELIRLGKEISAFENKHVPSEKELDEMKRDFADHRKKYGDIHKKVEAELSNNQEYLHEAQLLAERYNFDKNSSEYLKAIDELIYKFHPEIKEARELEKAILKKLVPEFKK